MNQKHPSGYISYEYKQVCTANQDASLFLDYYESFGWHMDDNRPIAVSGKTATLFLKRDKRLINRMELTRLQRNFEACVQEIRSLEQSKSRTASLWALVTGLLGTAFLAGSVFAVTHEPPLYLLMTLLAIPGLLGWTLPYFLYHWKRAGQTQKIQPLLEAKYAEIDQLCEKGHALL